tara:strand:- start:16579 stop:16758 length:180 start_codon:yes stop_codon:yes gene_type:complete
MRVALIPCVLLVLLSACEQEPTFEERYSEAEATISEQAQSIESDLEGVSEPTPTPAPTR